MTDAEVKLSRRVGAVMGVGVLLELTVTQRQALVLSVQRSKSFTRLPRKWRKMVKEAEAQLANA